MVRKINAFDLKTCVPLNCHYFAHIVIPKWREKTPNQ